MKEKLLVLDDESLILTSLQHLFEDDYEVFTTTSAETALRLATEHDMAVILCDERMPGISGHEFLRRVREVSKATRVMMSGYADMNALAEAVNSAQIFAYVAKPWKPLKLKAKVGAAAVHFKLESDLRHTNAELGKLNADLKNFSYATSHDLQEPLRMVKSYAQLLAQEYKGKLDVQADQFIAYTIDGAQRIETLLRDLRQYWLVNEPMAQCVLIDCVRVLQKAMQDLRGPIEESGARVTHEPLPVVVAEEVSVAMLFQNLLSNAIKYRRPGEPPSIHISAQKRANVWCFSVKDNGIGIEAEHLEDIFAPFKRLHGADYPGSGIGLAICSKIVERYGGRLWAESSYGQGSTFYFTIPARDHEGALVVASNQ